MTKAVCPDKQFILVNKFCKIVNIKIKNVKLIEKEES